jgi:hypothetical protein
MWGMEWKKWVYNDVPIDLDLFIHYRVLLKDWQYTIHYMLRHLEVGFSIANVWSTKCVRRILGVRA